MIRTWQETAGNAVRNERELSRSIRRIGLKISLLFITRREHRDSIVKNFVFRIESNILDRSANQLQVNLLETNSDIFKLFHSLLTAFELPLYRIQIYPSKHSTIICHNRRIKKRLKETDFLSSPPISFLEEISVGSPVFLSLFLITTPHPCQICKSPCRPDIYGPPTPHPPLSPIA